MNNNLLITSQVMRAYVRLPKQMLPEQIDFHIRNAQEQELQQLLGDEMYYHMLTNISAQKYQDLLNGKTYTASSGNTVNYPGLKPVLAFHAYARYVGGTNFQPTESGIVVKRTEHSNPVDGKQIALMIADARSCASTYERQVVKFMQEHSSDYDLWYGHVKNSNTTGFKVRAARGGRTYRDDNTKSKYRC